MNEITRIHLAKVAYDVELDAKRELETYERALRQRLEDVETLDDIEVRMSELLADRDVKPGGVITLEDVKAICEQLGQPSEFGEEKRALVGGNEKPVKKLYRDLDTAMLGGVMSGIAAYFKIDPTLVRISGMVLIALSFGTFLLAYILLWLLVPAARTASQRLELMGKSPTLENINTTGEATLSATAKIVRRILFVIAGVGAIGIAVMSLVVAVRLVFLYPISSFWNSNFLSNPSLFMAVAGVVFAMFMSVIAYGLLRRTWRRQLTFALVCMTLVGFVFSGMGAYGFIAQHYGVAGTYVGSTQEIKHFSVPDLSGIKKLVVDSNVPVYYSTGSPSLVVTATEIFQPTLTVSGDTATIHYNHRGDAQILVGGPALSTIEVINGGFGYTANGGSLSLLLGQSSTATLQGSLDTLQATLQGNGAVLDAEQLVVNAVKITKTSENVGESAKGQVVLATIGSLDITYPVACTTLAGLDVSVNSVAGALTANGQSVKLPFETGCFTLKHAEQ